MGTIFVGLGGWGATAPLAKAVAAGATLTVKGTKDSTLRRRNC